MSEPKTFEATDDDLPDRLWPRDRVEIARERIRVTAAEMSLEIEPEEMDLFALILVGLGKDDARSRRA